MNAAFSENAVAAATSHPIHRLLTKNQAAEILGVCLRTIENLSRRGVLPMVKVGTAARIDPEDLRRYIDKSKRGAA